MRLLGVQLGDGVAIDLHPYVSVVHGLDDRQRRAPVEAIEALPSGRSPLPGLVEAHGVLLDLDESNLALLDVRDGDIDIVVRAKDLPGSVASPTGRVLRTKQQALDDVDRRLERLRHDAAAAEHARSVAAAALERARRSQHDADADAATRLTDRDSLTAQLDQLTEHSRRVGEQLMAARAAAAAATTALTEIEDATSSDRAARRRAVDETTRLAAALEAARNERDPMALATLEAARAELDEVRRAHDLARSAEAQRAQLGGDDPAERLVAIDDRVEELRNLLAVLVPADPNPVSEALELVRGDSDHDLVASPEAISLADDIEKVEARLREQGQGGAADGDRVAAARGRLDAARAALIEAEQSARVPELDRTEVDALENAHAVVLDSQDKADARFGGARAKKRLDDARTAERAILGRLGFSTYADFMMGTSMLNIDPVTEARLDSARNELVEAEDEWRELQLALDSELERGALLDRRRELRERAQLLLGVSSAQSDVVTALRELRVPAVDALGAEVELRLALDHVGLPVADEAIGGTSLVHLAETWIAEDQRASDRRREVVAELDTLVAERAALNEIVAALRIGDDDLRAADREVQLAAAEQALVDAEARAARHRDADARAAELEVQLEEAAGREQGTTATATAVESQVDAAIDAERAAITALEELEAEAAAIAASEAAAAAELRRLEGASSGDAPTGPPVDIEVDTGAADEAANRALTAATELAAAETDRRNLAAEVEHLLDQHATATGEIVPSADEVEWYLLARMAAQRSVSYAGSLPLLLDDALGALDDLEVTRLLERIERMAATVQLIVLSDSPALLSWAVNAGVERAALVGPERVTA
jgi:hypothetical protein